MSYLRDVRLAVEPLVLAVCMVCGVWFVMGFVLDAVKAQEKPKITMVLSELEQTKLDKLRLQSQVFEYQVQLGRRQLNDELQKFVTDTLKAHKYPPGAYFDMTTFRFVVKEEPKTEPVKK